MTSYFLDDTLSIKEAVI